MLNVGNYLDNYLIIATSAGKLGKTGGDNIVYKSGGVREGRIEGTDKPHFA